MASDRLLLLLLRVTFLLTSLSRAALCATFTLTNSCGYTVWPGLLSSAGSPPLATTGFALAPGESRAVAGADGAGIACKSACEAFGTPEYCCSGAFGRPATCQPSAYSQFFKNACPRAYSYAYDDATSTFTCASGTVDYLVVFCPSISSLKSSVGGGANPSTSGAGLPLINDTVSFLNHGGGGGGGYYDASCSSSPAAPSCTVLLLLLLAHAATAVLAACGHR
uniref:Thaumatin-like protein n=1 Tax=Oryza brachyantha TaxID=4533 RepID=J3MZK2_ORYBR